LLRIHTRGLVALERGVTAQALANLPVLARSARAKSEIGEAALSDFDELETAVEREYAALEDVAQSS
jgi:hypothetical protein